MFNLAVICSLLLLINAELLIYDDGDGSGDNMYIEHKTAELMLAQYATDEEFIPVTTATSVQSPVSTTTRVQSSSLNGFICALVSDELFWKPANSEDWHSFEVTNVTDIPGTQIFITDIAYNPDDDVLHISNSPPISDVRNVSNNYHGVWFIKLTSLEVTRKVSYRREGHLQRLFSLAHLNLLVVWDTFYDSISLLNCIVQEDVVHSLHSHTTLLDYTSTSLLPRSVAAPLLIPRIFFVDASSAERRVLYSMDYAGKDIEELRVLEPGDIIATFDDISGHLYTCNEYAPVTLHNVTWFQLTQHSVLFPHSKRASLTSTFTDTCSPFNSNIKVYNNTMYTWFNSEFVQTDGKVRSIQLLPFKTDKGTMFQYFPAFTQTNYDDPCITVDCSDVCVPVFRENILQGVCLCGGNEKAVRGRSNKCSIGSHIVAALYIVERRNGPRTVLTQLPGTPEALKRPVRGVYFHIDKMVGLYGLDWEDKSFQVFGYDDLALTTLCLANTDACSLYDTPRTVVLGRNVTSGQFDPFGGSFYSIDDHRAIYVTALHIATKRRGYRERSHADMRQRLIYNGGQLDKRYRLTDLVIDPVFGRVFWMQVDSRSGDVQVKGTDSMGLSGVRTYGILRSGYSRLKGDSHFAALSIDILKKQVVVLHSLSWRLCAISYDVEASTGLQCVELSNPLPAAPFVEITGFLFHQSPGSTRRDLVVGLRRSPHHRSFLYLISGGGLEFVPLMKGVSYALDHMHYYGPQMIPPDSPWNSSSPCSSTRPCYGICASVNNAANCYCDSGAIFTRSCFYDDVALSILWTNHRA